MIYLTGKSLRKAVGEKMHANTNTENNSEKTANLAEQYFSFMLAGEEYGVNILSVVEIRGWEQPTPLPSTPPFVKGVINLRGVIIPVIDLRERFSMCAIEHGKSTVIIVLQAVYSEEVQRKKMVGIVADAVSDVYNVKENQINPKPEIATGNVYEYINGLATIRDDDGKDKLIIMLDANKILELETRDMDDSVMQSGEIS